MFLEPKEVFDLTVSEADSNKKVTVSYSIPPYSDYSKFKLTCTEYDRSSNVVYYDQEFEDQISGELFLKVQ